MSSMRARTEGHAAVDAHRRWAAVLAGSVIVMLAAYFGEAGPGVQLPMALWFILVCPGMALVRCMKLDNPLAEWALAIGLSIAVETVVAGVLVYGAMWSAGTALVVLSLITVAGALPDAARAAGLHTPANILMPWRLAHGNR
ncbi:MAG: hypothetical protein JO247_23975 [Chloroflexi bacterium]|nr:hypothetical protein [Chloroflexota bacterium]